jgi:hypothetical protein
MTRAEGLLARALVVTSLAATLPTSGLSAQTTGAAVAFAAPPNITPVPWGKGEYLEYSLKIGFIEAGSGRMQVVGLDTVRGRSVWRLRFNITGGVSWLGVRVNDSYDSYLDTETLNSLRFVQDLNEPGSKKVRIYDIFPEKQTYIEHGKPEAPSVADPLDDASLFFHLRTIPLEVGKKYEIPRYFDPKANPVTIQVLRKETISVGAGRFNAIVIRPIIKTSGLFADGGQAEIWLSDDDRHILLRMNVKLGSIASLSLNLRKMQNVMPPKASPSTDTTKRP